MPVPDDMMRFVVPGSQAEMDALRALYWEHYIPDGPLWDEWLRGPDLFPMYPIVPMGPKAPLWDEWLLPALLAPNRGAASARMQALWDQALSTRSMDDEGYVATHQNASYAHQAGWPFPIWSHGEGGWGWHFSWGGCIGALGTPMGLANRPPALASPADWDTEGVSDMGVGQDGWHLRLDRPLAAVISPEHPIDAFEAPFLQVRWSGRGLEDAMPYIAWATTDDPTFCPERRIYLDPPTDTMTYVMAPVHRCPSWRGTITRLRLGFGNAKACGTVCLQALFTQYDTRHTINNLNYARACALFYAWTGDLSFLRRNINRARLAMRAFESEHCAEHEGPLPVTRWVGHDGRSGLERDASGQVNVRSGHGIGGNYWDILPFGHLDAYAAIHYVDALRTMADLEEAVDAHPAWNLPSSPLRLEPARLRQRADAACQAFNETFWLEPQGRFAGWIDADGQAYDYGFTFVNLEAIHYDVATPEHASRILTWLDGERLVAGDTSQGEDIYYWEFGPRTTTVRNLETYGWVYRCPEATAFGDQVQDGGAVLGFSFYDVMARLRLRGPDNAWARLRAILDWYQRAHAAGGYEAYYRQLGEGTLQGAGHGGGLGIQQEFFESVMIARLPIEGFAGFRPRPDGLTLKPRLPSHWPELSVGPLRWRGLSVDLRITPGAIDMELHGQRDDLWTVRLDATYDRGSIQGDDGAWRSLEGVCIGDEMVYRVPSMGLRGLRFRRAAG